MIKNNLKRNHLLLFFISREQRQLKGRTLIGEFAVFKLLVALLRTKLYTHDIKFLHSTCIFLVTGILICKMLLFVKCKSPSIRFVFYLSYQTITVISEMLFFLKAVTEIKQKTHLNIDGSFQFLHSQTLPRKQFQQKQTFLLLDFDTLKNF